MAFVNKTTVFVEEQEQNGLQKDFSTLLEDSFHKSLKAGSVVVGEIMTVDKDSLTVDIGGKCEGTVAAREVPGGNRNIALSERYHKGQICDFYILREFEDENPYVLSLKRVEYSKQWDELAKLCQNGTIMDVTVSSVTKGGVLVEVLSLKGFIPASQLRVAKTLEALVGDVIPAKLLEVDKTKNKLILSHREAVFEAQSERRKSTLGTLTQGMTTDGEVVKITHFGAFVDIDGIDGLLPLSEISWRRLKHPEDVLKLGQQVTVQVLTIDHALERVSLSMKRLESDPWETVTEHFKIGDMVTAPVSKLLNMGFLSELAPGIEAFCSYQKVDKAEVMVGETRSFKIVSMDIPDHRITLEPA